MGNREDFCVFNRYGEYHKGFYNDGDPIKTLLKIYYTDYFEYNDDDDFPYDTAHSLLCGSCHHFALSLKKACGYTPYIIEGRNKRGFHAFCQIYRNRKWFYVDARGITSCFSEFMDVAKTFVTDEYTIRPVSSDDIEEWEKGSQYNGEAYAFSEAVINEYQECYLF